MTSKKLFIFMLLFLANISFSQQKENGNIIRKDIKINNGNDIYDVPTNTSFNTIQAIKNYNKKTLVYYNEKFFPIDTLYKIKDKNDFTLDVIKIPDSITKDIQVIIFMKKVVK